MRSTPALRIAVALRNPARRLPLPNRHGHRRRAVTLLELVVVVTLLSIGAAVAGPRWANTLQKHRVKQAAARLVVDLSRAQSAAYNSSTSKTVTFTLSNSQYLVSGVKGVNTSSAPYLVNLSDDPYRSTLVSVWGQNSGSQTITFNGYGLPDRGGNIIVASGSNQMTIVVDPASGSAVIL